MCGYMWMCGLGEEDFQAQSKRKTRWGGSNLIMTKAIWDGPECETLRTIGWICFEKTNELLVLCGLYVVQRVIICIVSLFE